MPANKHYQQIARIIKYWLPVLLCMVFIFYTSSLPGDDLPELFAFQNIVYHILVYLILGVLCSRAIKKSSSGIKPVKIILYTVVFGVFYGLTDELHQAFVPYRCASGFDIFIDGIGSSLGSFIYR